MKIHKTYLLEEVADLCGIEPQIIERYVACAWIVPENDDENRFDEEDMARIRLIQELRNTFAVNDEAVPIILHLVDQLNVLHRRMKDYRF